MKNLLERFYFFDLVEDCYRLVMVYRLVFGIFDVEFM